MELLRPATFEGQQRTHREQEHTMQKISRYEIISAIGSGGMGVVYRARDTELGRTVAIKTLRLGELTTPQETRTLRERLLREAQAAGNLNHPNVVAIHDFGQEGDTAFIVMELVEGQTFQDLLSRASPPSRDLSLRILAEAASALDYAHSCGAIHRDVKPANIMIRSDGTVKIADFGIAKLTWAKTMTESGMVVGSPHYMAPEQLRGEPVSPKTDQFGLAGVAYALLTGRKPFDADTVASLFHKILHENPVPVHVLTPGINPEVDRVLQKAMAKNPAGRYANCTEFVNALKGAWLGAAAPATEAKHRRRNLLVAGVATVILALLVFGGISLYKRHQKRLEEAFWDSAKSRGEAAQFEAYLQKYPDGRFTTQARAAIKELNSRARVEPTKPESGSGGPISVIPTPAPTAPLEQPKKKSKPAPSGVCNPDALIATSAAASGAIKVNPIDEQPYVWIAPGTFQMGCSAGDDECENAEKPSHTVTITKGFWIGQTEVTVGAYRKFASATGRELTRVQRSLQETDYPMALTSWDDAAAYCRWAGGRLPTEAEWEYAGRGGTAGPRYGEPDLIAWYDSNGRYKTQRVRQLAPNPYGLYDMLGNAWERVADWYDEKYYAKADPCDPKGPPKGRTGVVRGGSCSSRADLLRISYRGMKDKEGEDISTDVGFRCVREAMP